MLRNSQDLVQRMAWVVLAVFLLSPAQYPWYLVWILPFMVLRDPLRGVQAATVVLPVYYTSFYFRGHNIEWIFNDIIVFAIWLPIWLTFCRDLKRPIAQALRHLGKTLTGRTAS